MIFIKTFTHNLIDEAKDTVMCLTDGEENSADCRRWECRNGGQTVHRNICCGGDCEVAVGVHENPVWHWACAILPFINRCAIDRPGDLWRRWPAACHTLERDLISLCSCAVWPCNHHCATLWRQTQVKLALLQHIVVFLVTVNQSWPFKGVLWRNCCISHLHSVTIWEGIRGNLWSRSLGPCEPCERTNITQ